ncbi:hypothetical protein Tco_1380038 [Tanacetum coccineum]
MAPRGRPTRTTRARPVTATPPPVTTTPPPVTDPTTTTSVTNAQLQAMIDEGVTAVLAARATTRNGDDSHTSGTGARRNERTCSKSDLSRHQMKCQPLFLQGYRRSDGQLDPVRLRGWKPVVSTVTNEVAYAMTWSDLKKKMTTKYCPRNEIKKVEAGDGVCASNAGVTGCSLKEPNKKVKVCQGGMPDPIYSSVVASKPKTMQEAIEMATGLMDRRNNTLAERQAENKRKLEDTPRNNQTPTEQKAEHRQGVCCRER